MANSMGLIEVSRPDGKWLVEGDMLRQLVRCYTSAELFLANYSEKTLAETEKESSIGEAVSKYDMAIEGANMTSASIDSLVVGATVGTGGAGNGFERRVG